MTIRDILPQTVRAYELYGDFWFNSEPVPVAALRGQVILLDFWDSTSLGSIRSLVYVKEWVRKYAPYGLVTVGVHTPRFSFAKDPENVRLALRRYGITFPVVMDNEGTIAARYGSMRWPTIMLVDKDGFIRYRSEGDSNYQSTEHALQTMLYQAGVGEDLPMVTEPPRDEDRAGALFYRTTPELFGGYRRGSIGNVEGINPESIVDYADPGIYLSDRIYLDGPWMNSNESLRFEGEQGSIILEYEGVEVCAVLRYDERGAVEVGLTQDGSGLVAGLCGEDARSESGRGSVVTVDSPRMYSLVRNRDHERHTLRLTVKGRGLTVFGFAFAASAILELVQKN